jgi:hypothetical protein
MDQGGKLPHSFYFGKEEGFLQPWKKQTSSRMELHVNLRVVWEFLRSLHGIGYIWRKLGSNWFSPLLEWFWNKIHWLLKLQRIPEYGLPLDFHSLGGMNKLLCTEWIKIPPGVYTKLQDIWNILAWIGHNLAATDNTCLQCPIWTNTFIDTYFNIK